MTLARPPRRLAQTPSPNMSLGHVGGEIGGVFGGERLFVGVGHALESVERKRTSKMRMVEESLVRESIAWERLLKSLVKDWLFFN